MKNYLQTFYNYNLLETVGSQTNEVSSDILKDDATIQDLEFLDMQKFAEYLLRMKPKMVDDDELEFYFNQRNMIPYSHGQTKEEFRQENIEKWNWLIKRHYQPFYYNEYGPTIKIFKMIITEDIQDTDKTCYGYKVVEKIKGKWNIWISFYSDNPHGRESTNGITVKYSEIPLDIRQEICDKILKELNL